MTASAHPEPPQAFDLCTCGHVRLSHGTHGCMVPSGTPSRALCSCFEFTSIAAVRPPVPTFNELAFFISRLISVATIHSDLAVSPHGKAVLEEARALLLRLSPPL